MKLDPSLVQLLYKISNRLYSNVPRNADPLVINQLRQAKEKYGSLVQ